MAVTSELIITQPEAYLKYKRVQLDKMLAEIALSDKDEEYIRNSRAGKVFVDDALGEIPGFALAKRLLTWKKDVDEEIKDAKKELLIVNTIEKIQTLGNSVSTIIDFLSSTQGNILFSKIQQITDDNPPDPALLDHLSNVVKNILRSDFLSLFNDHKYALSQIETMSPHSMTIIADNANWPRFKSPSGVSMGNVISSPWTHEFAKSYFAKKALPANIQKLIQHCLDELETKKFVQGINLENGESCMRLTPIGMTILKYLQ